MAPNRPGNGQRHLGRNSLTRVRKAGPSPFEGNQGVAHPSSDAPECPFIARCLSYRWAVWMMVELGRFANWNAGLDHDYRTHLLINTVWCRDLSGPYRASAAPASRR